MKTQASTRTIGIDLGDRKHAICVLEETGEPVKESIITNTRESPTKQIELGFRNSPKSSRGLLLSRPPGERGEISTEPLIKPKKKYLLEINFKFRLTAFSWKAQQGNPLATP